MKKKTFQALLPIFIVAALCMTLTSCGGGDDSDDPVPPTPTNNGDTGDASGSGGSLGYDPGVAPDGAQTIDLGLPSGTLWANMNVGATTAEGAGLYFAWGETTGYGNNPSDGRLFDWDAYKYGSETYPEIFKYCTDSQIGTVDNKTQLELADDAARANWKGDWRMPTRDEFQELLDNTTQERTTLNGVSGIKLTSKKNGNSIFFPAIGYRLRDEIILYGEGAWCWTSSLDYDKDVNKYLDYNATAFGFGKSGNISKTSDGRSYGLNVRAVIGNEGITPTGDEPTEPEGPEPTYPNIQSTPLTLEAISGGSFTFKNKAAGAVTYQVGGGAIQTIPANSSKTIYVTAGKRVRFFGDNTTYATNGSDNYSFISSNTDFYVYGNIMSLVNSTNYATATTLTDSYTFAGLFRNNTHLKSHPSYELLLPAITLTSNCYYYMFSGCTSLTSAPALPATTLASDCYNAMFSGCTSLKTAPVLPATTLAKSCYSAMFNDCTSLTSAPELPATTLANSCYATMFKGCTSLTSAPELPATTMKESCYAGMFNGCTALIVAPELPSKDLDFRCYTWMFENCTSLTTAPSVLPSKTVSNYCYDGMFSGCTSLTKAPDILAISLSGGECVYRNMFRGCSNLKYVKCMSRHSTEKQNFLGWLSGVSSPGTFVKSSNRSWPRGESGIPTGWTVVEE